MLTFVPASGRAVKPSTTRPMKRCSADRPEPDTLMRIGDGPGVTASSSVADFGPSLVGANDRLTVHDPPSPVPNAHEFRSIWNCDASVPTNCAGPTVLSPVAVDDRSTSCE